MLAIVVGATLAFYCFGLRGRQKTKSWANRAIMGLVISTFILAIPLSAFLWNLAQRSPRGLAGQVSQLVNDQGYRLKHLERRSEEVEIRVQGPQNPTSKLLTPLSQMLRENLGSTVKIRVITELAVELE